ncbi:MAG: MFS transporter [SAR86 cluster bacterium]|uniref:MFS transporter n=1 Tax=SAR86 cluster bacterium TaxID=2030880 RepID=A0A520N5B9_9GAMM|nr:MAG: MFS transporter [SAR86 cluster bacterium]
MSKTKLTKEVKAWISYDLGNSAFATTVLAAFFPIFYNQYWARELDSASSAEYLSWTLVISNLTLLFTAPLIGAITDISKSTKLMFVSMVSISIVCVGLLFFLQVGSWMYALVFFGIANYFFSASNVLYDKILVQITSPDLFSKISGYGYAWGYFGGGLLFLVNALMSLYPEMFGLESQADAIRWSFITVSVWWTIFLLPLSITYKERVVNTSEKVIRDSFNNFIDTLKSVSKYKNAFIFLIAFFLYIDGVHTVIALASTFALNLGLDTSSIIIALILVQFVAFPSTLMWSLVAEKYGEKIVINITIIIYIILILYSLNLSNGFEFYTLAGLIGFIQGGIQGSSRSLFAKLIPSDKAGAFFGLFNTFGKAAAFIGPALIGLFLVIFKDTSLMLLPLLVLFVLGIIVLYFVKTDEII